MLLDQESINFYIQRRQQDVTLLTGELRKGNFEEFKRIGHQLKGNGATFGFPEIGELGKRLEKAALENNVPELQNLLKDLDIWAKRKKNQ